MAWVYYVSNKLGVMSEEDKQSNVLEIYNQLGTNGWTVNAISGLLGNIDYESGINPGQTQNGYKIGNPNAGFGLVQWTPGSKFTEWASNNDHDINSGYWQIVDIDEQSHGIEWITTTAYPLSYDEFKASNDTPAYLTEVFLKNYERAGTERLETRVELANKWYEFLSGQPAPEPPEPDPQPYKKNKSGMPLYFMMKNRNLWW